MSFETSVELLKFHWVAYTIYALLIISIIAWFGLNLTRENTSSVVRIPFYGYIAFLVAGGVGHHIFTYNAIPWVAEDIMRHDLKIDQTVNISIEKHKWQLPATPIKIKANTRVEFNVESKDLMYGFGIFRKDGSLVTQMQVNPASKNDLVWTFKECGTFDITSTEYSGPHQYDESGKDLMKVAGAVVVEGCEGGSK